MCDSQVDISPSDCNSFNFMCFNMEEDSSVYTEPVFTNNRHCLDLRPERNCQPGTHLWSKFVHVCQLCPVGVTSYCLSECSRHTRTCTSRHSLRATCTCRHPQRVSCACRHPMRATCTCRHPQRASCTCRHPLRATSTCKCICRHPLSAACTCTCRHQLRATCTCTCTCRHPLRATCTCTSRPPLRATCTCTCTCTGRQPSEITVKLHLK